VSTATDVWALGCLLSCLLTGRSPWRPLPGESTEALRRRIRTAAGPPPEWNLGRTPSPGLRLSTGQARDLEAIVRRCLQLQPQARYGSAREVAEDVRRHLEGRPVAARGDSKLYRWGRAIRRNRVALVAAVLLVLLVGVAMRLLVQQAREAERQLLQAERVMSFVQEVLRPEVITAPGVTAASVIEAGVDTARRRFASDPEIEAAVLTALGSQLSALEAYPSARSALSRALELRRNLGDLEGQVEATTALAWVEVEDEQLERGLEEMEQLVRELRRRPARDRLVLADALYEQGFLVLRRVPEDDPRKADAWAHLLEALQILEAVLPEGHPLRARAEFAVGLATVPQEDGVERLERAVAHMRRQGEGSEEALAHAVGDLALVYENVGRQEDAVRTAQEAIELIERIRSPGNADRLIMLNNLAGILRDAGRYAAAEPLYEEVLEGRLRMFSDDASVLAFPLYGLGRVRMGLGRYDEAVEDLRQARDLVEAQGWFQEGVAVRLALGESLLEAGDLDEAATLLDQLTEDLQQRAPGGSELEQVEQLQEQLAQRQGEASS
jgi:tetratricopeptide (TPR) repeat protein